MKKLLLLTLMIVGFISQTSAQKIVLGTEMTFEDAVKSTDGFAIVCDGKVLARASYGLDSNTGIYGLSAQLSFVSPSQLVSSNATGYFFTATAVESANVNPDAPNTYTYYHFNLFKPNSTCNGKGDADDYWGGNIMSPVGWQAIWATPNNSTYEENGVTYTRIDGRDFNYGSQWAAVAVDGGYHLYNSGDTNHYMGSSASMVANESDAALIKFYSINATLTAYDPLNLNNIVDFSTEGTRDSETGLIQNGNAGWTFATPQDWSAYKYLIVNVTRNARNQSCSLYITDGTNTMSGEDYKKYNGTDYSCLEAGLVGGNMWLDTWNNQRIAVIDLDWINNRSKNGEGNECKYVDITKITAFGINANSVGVYLGNAFLTNTMPTYSTWGGDADYTLKTASNTFTAGDYRTVCLPYRAVCCGADIYEIAGKGESSISLRKVTGFMEAGKPYFFKKTEATIHDGTETDDNDGVYFYKAGPVLATSPVVNNGLIGTYINITSLDYSSNDKLYVLSKNQIWHVNSAVAVSANKAYIDMSQIGTSYAKALINLPISGTDDATSISNVESSAMNQKSSIVYDLQGRQVTNPTHGIYIIGGKKIAFK